MAEPDEVERIVTQLAGAQQALHIRIARVLERVGDLSVPQFMVLHQIRRDPTTGWTITGLAEDLSANQPAISKTVQHLVRRDYLEPRPDRVDRRLKHHFITATGILAHGRAIKALAPDLQRPSMVGSMPRLRLLRVCCVDCAAGSTTTATMRRPSRAYPETQLPRSAPLEHSEVELRHAAHPKRRVAMVDQIIAGIGVEKDHEVVRFSISQGTSS